MSKDDLSGVVPIAKEEAHVEKREIITGRVRVHTVTKAIEELIHQDLAQERVEVSRISIDREIEVVPEIRQDGDVTIIPVVEEILIIEKRLILKEEIHIQRIRSVEPIETRMVLRKQEAVVERLDVDDTNELPKGSVK